MKYVVIATKKDTGDRGFIRIEEGGYPYFTPDFSPALLVTCELIKAYKNLL